MKKTSLTIAAILVSALYSCQASAKQVILAVEGKITTKNDSSSNLGSNISIGDKVFATVIYDTGLKDSNTADPAEGFYDSGLIPNGIIVTINGFLFSSQGLGVNSWFVVFDQPGHDAFQFFSEAPNFGSFGLDRSVISFELSDSLATALKSDKLPGKFPRAKAWDSRRLVLTTVTACTPFDCGPPEAWTLVADINSIKVAD